MEDLNPLSERNPKKSRRSGNPCLEIITLRIMPHETLKVRLLEFIGMELDNLYVEREYVERNYVERNEFFLSNFDSPGQLLMTNLIVILSLASVANNRMSTSFFIIFKLYLRSEFENLRTHYLMA